MRRIVPLVAIALLLLAPGRAYAAPEPPSVPGINLDGLGGAIANAIREMVDSWLENSPPALAGGAILRSVGWMANNTLAGQVDVAEDSGGFLIELNRDWLTQNAGVRTGYAMFAGLIASWIALHAMWNGLKCIVTVGRDAMGETIQAIGPRILIPVFLAVNGLALADWLIQALNLMARALFVGGPTVADTLRTAQAAGAQTDANLSMGAYVLSVAGMFLLLGLSRLAVHGIAAMCVVTLVPALLASANPPTQWIFSTWKMFAMGALLGHVLQAVMLRIGGGMVADAFSGAQGGLGSANQITATFAAASTMGLAAAIPAMVGLGAAAHSFGVGRLIGGFARSRIPQRTDSIEDDRIPTPQRSPEGEREQVYEVKRQDVVITRMAPVRPAAGIATTHSYDGPPTHPAAQLPPPTD